MLDWQRGVYQEKTETLEAGGGLARLSVKSGPILAIRSLPEA